MTTRLVVEIGMTVVFCFLYVFLGHQYHGDAMFADGTGLGLPIAQKLVRSPLLLYYRLMVVALIC